MRARELFGCQLSIFATDDSYDRVCSEFAGTQRIINSVTRKWLDDARGIANKK